MILQEFETVDSFSLYTDVYLFYFKHNTSDTGSFRIYFKLGTLKVSAEPLGSNFCEKLCHTG